METKKIFLLLLLIALVSSCSKNTSKTSAKLNLKLSGIVNLTSGIGSGGALLFGKSSTGEQFGKIISSTEHDIELPNGDWNFYAVMWEDTLSTGKFSDTVYCGKSTQKLAGIAVNISMSLSNSVCVGSEFSDGSHYFDTKNKFPNLFIEECDELSKSNSFTCMRDNQGSAISYRMAFKGYTRTPTGALLYDGQVLHSQCKSTQGTLGMFKKGTGLNFPTAHQSMPFVISVEMFLGSPDCGATTPELKGMYTHGFENGIAAGTSPGNKKATSPVSTCSVGPANEVSCLNYFGTWNGSSCILADPIMSLFLPIAECGGTSNTFVSKSLKQMVTVPRDLLCQNLNPNFNLTGFDVFSGGNGSSYRPFKICNEWQLNQIGEKFSTISQSNHYKLMSDLDMNNISFGIYPKPYCADKLGVDKYFNLNPLDRMDCETVTATGIPYSGVFNGNDKVIKNGRIGSKTMDYIGLTRTLAGTIKNLNFQNLEVRGISYVGGIAGSLSPNAKIENVRVKKLEIEGNSNIGGLVGLGANNTLIKNVKIDHGRIRGSNFIGGIIGNNDGIINKASFRGFIVEHDSVGDYSGGIAAINSGEISEVFSEGVISTTTIATAGVVGKNMNILKNCYSTMTLIPQYSAISTSLKTGGIVAYNFGGASVVNNCYSGTVFSYTGVSTPNYQGVVSVNEGFLDTSSVYTDSNNVPGTAYSVSYDLMRGATAPAGVSFTIPSLWTFAAGSLPRLAWETDERECLLPGMLSPVSIQRSNGKGVSSTNPILICNIDQFAEIGNGQALDFYKLGDDINLSKWSSKVNLISNFSGNLDGNVRSLSGLKIIIPDDSTNSAYANFGIINTVAGSIKNLLLIGNQITSLDADYSNIGILAGSNSGNISKIESYGLTVKGSVNIGGLVGVNNIAGVVTGITSNRSELIGEFGVGGIVGNNKGKIIKASAVVNISNGTYNYYQRIGGIAGYNNNLIDQTMASGTFNFPSISLAPTHSLGGLVGYSFDSGIISNSYTGKHTIMNIGGVSGIGGAVGVLDGGSVQLKKSFSLTKMNFTQAELDLTGVGKLDQTNDASDDRIIGPLVGTIFNSSITSNNFYIKNSLVIAGGMAQISNCGPPVTITGGPALSSDGVFSLPEFLGPMNYSFVSASELTPLNSFLCTINSYVNLYKAYGNYSEHGQALSSNDFKQMGIFTGAGFNIADGDSPSVINYYLAVMNGDQIPSTSPIWEHNSDDQYPQLLQLGRH